MGVIMSKRIYGIDVLRIGSMLGVIILHILGHGNILYTTDSGLGFTIANLLNIIAYPAVNCFVLISGFVGYRDDRYYPKIKSVLSLFLTVLFYSVIICIIFKVFYPDIIDANAVIGSCFPVLSSRYWFFSKYILMILVSPMLNCFVHKANNKMLTITFYLIFLFTFLSMFNLINFDNGFSFLWFIMLYLIGAITKKLNLVDKVPFSKSTVLIVVSVLITFVTKIGLHFSGISLPFISEDMFLSYSSITMLVYSVALLLVFAKLNINKTMKMIISFLSPTAFSVYLIHDNIYVREMMIKDRFSFVNNYNEITMIFMILGFAVAIFICCAFIDRVRILIFKAVHVDEFLDKVEVLIKNKVNSLLDKVNY